MFRSVGLGMHSASIQTLGAYMDIVKWLTDPHTFDNLDSLALRATSSLLLFAGLVRWLISDGKITLKQRRRAKEELLREREKTERFHAKHTHAASHKA